MAKGRPKAKLVLNEAEEAQLSSFARSRSLPAALSLRARIVLGCAASDNNHAVAQPLECHDTTVGKWRKRFLKHRIAGLYDELRPGKPRSIDDEQVAMLIRRTLEKKPKNGSTHWSAHRCRRERDIQEQRTALFHPVWHQAAPNQEL